MNFESFIATKKTNNTEDDRWMRNAGEYWACICHQNETFYGEYCCSHINKLVEYRVTAKVFSFFWKLLLKWVYHENFAIRIQSHLHSKWCRRKPLQIPMDYIRCVNWIWLIQTFCWSYVPENSFCFEQLSLMFHREYEPITEFLPLIYVKQESFACNIFRIALRTIHNRFCVYLLYWTLLLLVRFSFV